MSRGERIVIDDPWTVGEPGPDRGELIKRFRAALPASSGPAVVVMAKIYPAPGDRVRFAPNPRYPEKKIEARVERWRFDPRRPGQRESARAGWLDTVDDDGKMRSVRPSKCEILP